MQAAEVLLDLGIGDDAALLEVDQQHLARLQAPLGDDLLLGDRQHAGFRRHHDEPVVGDEVARRAQAVTVERGADLASVGEGHGGGAVPRLHHRGVVLVEGAALLVHERVAGPGLGDEHHHGMGQRVAALHQELERVVEARRVGLALVGDRPELGDVLAEKVGRHRGLTGRHPVDVAAQRVDLAVVGDVAVGMGQLPRRERVGREALVHQGERRGEGRVGEVLEVVAELSGEQQALVDDRAGRHRHGVIAGEALVLAAEHLVRDGLAQDEEPALERVLIAIRGARDEDLAGRRLARLDALAKPRGVDRHVAPSEQSAALLGDGLGDDRLDVGAGRLVLGQEHDADGVVAGRRQLEAGLLRLGNEELVRNLHQHAAAVAGLGVGPGGAAMVEVQQDLETHAHDVVGLGVVHVGDEADAAGVVLLGRIVEPVGLGNAGIAHDDIAAHARVRRRLRLRSRHDLAVRLVAARHVLDPSDHRHRQSSSSAERSGLVSNPVLFRDLRESGLAGAECKADAA